MGRVGQPQDEPKDEPKDEPQDEPKDERQRITDAQRERILELHLRGVPKSRIAHAVGVHRDSVARVLHTLYRELAGERREKLERKLAVAVARMRRIQEQAWEDHDRAGDEAGSAGQRAQHLRIALDAEKEIARLEGLYEGVVEDGATVVLRIERMERVGAGSVVGVPSVAEPAVADGGEAEGGADAQG